MIKGSLRKHGHGAPWKHRYRVLEVRPHAVRLLVPQDGTVPIVDQWQLMRRMEPSPEETHRPRLDDPRLTEYGILVPGTPGDVTADLPDPSATYDVEKILRATKVGGKYVLWVKWSGHQDPTPVPRAQLLQDINHPVLLKEIDDAVARYQEEKRLEEDDADELDQEDDDTDDNDVTTPPILTGRVPRVHRPPVQYTPSI